MSEIEFRSEQTQIADVSYPTRTVTVIVAPYDSPTTINTPHRSYTEIVTRGAFDGVQRRAGSIRVNRDHDWGRIAGKITGLFPDRDEGLVGEVKIAKTVIGDETLELCADGCLSASAGFALMHENGLSGPIKRGAEIWENNRTVRRLKELWLDHVAFVPNPAYEAAAVIDVRRQAERDADVVAMPNRDRLELDRLRAQLAAINIRFGV